MPPLKLPRFFLFISLQALWSQVLDASFEGSCLLGGFYFVSGRNMVVDHSIQGAGFLNLTVSSPRECFRECSWNCRCISFNFRRSLHSNNCELNEESRSTAPRSLKKEVDCHHYDLVMDYSVHWCVLFSFPWFRHLLLFQKCSSSSEGSVETPWRSKREIGCAQLQMKYFFNLLQLFQWTTF